VASLPNLVQRANDFREITGEGFTFLNIPRTYYGLLDTQLLEADGASSEVATAVLAALTEAKLMDDVGAVDLKCVAPGSDSATALLDGALAKVAGYGGEVRDKVKR
jgi:hypothetical protein